MPLGRCFFVPETGTNVPRSGAVKRVFDFFFKLLQYTKRVVHSPKLENVNYHISQVCQGEKNLKIAVFGSTVPTTVPEGL